MDKLFDALLLPIIMGVVGIMVRWNNLPSNLAFGYRTKRSMQNEDMWQYAQILSGKCYMFLAAILITIISLLWMLGLLEHISGKVITYMELIVLVAPVVWIEYKLKKRSEENAANDE